MELEDLNEGIPKGNWSSTWFSIVQRCIVVPLGPRHLLMAKSNIGVPEANFPITTTKRLSWLKL
jgi:hypothetical protein